jgi:hypothetical protein
MWDVAKYVGQSPGLHPHRGRRTAATVAHSCQQPQAAAGEAAHPSPGLHPHRGHRIGSGRGSYIPAAAGGGGSGSSVRVEMHHRRVQQQ